MLKQLAAAGFLLLTLGCAAHRGPTVIELVSVFETYERLEKPMNAVPPPLAGDSHAKYLPILVQIAEKHGYPVAFADLTEFAFYGLTSKYPTQYILLDPRYPANAQVATLVHELGHALSPVDLIEKNEGQAVAETVAYLVMKELKLDVSAYTFWFLQGAGTPEERKLVREWLLEYQPLIDEIVRIILTAVYDNEGA